MKINKKQYTYHGFKRTRERTGIDDKDKKLLGSHAVRNGLNFYELPPGPLKSYVGFKIAKKGKRVKLYRGYVFIFFKTSNRIITCYEIPERHLEEYKKIIKDKNKLKKHLT